MRTGERNDHSFNALLNYIVIFLLSLVAACILYGILKSSAVANRPGMEVGGAAAGFMVIFFISYSVVKSLHKQRLECLRDIVPGYDIDGKWSYEAASVEGRIRAYGICNIHRDGLTAYINGTRNETRIEGIDTDTNPLEWHSEWAAITHDHKFRFDYNIQTTDGRPDRGYCVVNLTADPINRMDGRLFRLSPGTLEGTIAFKRIET